MKSSITKGYDLIGNIAIVKFVRRAKTSNKKGEALKLLKAHKSVRTVLEKKDRFKGRLRMQKTKWILGEKTKESLYKENGCQFRLNVDTCYFSPRLANDRFEIAKSVKKNENVLIMFGGVAPYAIVIAKVSKPRKIVSVELSIECDKYASENVKRNKFEKKIDLIQGDVKKALPKLKRKFDRIVMTRPNLKDSFFNIAFSKIKKGGYIHYYGFYQESELKKLKELVNYESMKAGKDIKILKIKKAGDIGIRKFRYRVDFRVLN
ncbi:class I SAM-dependent methyltransferase family protein [Candidatus Pacearchaeota archaeon]|nr:class I SAM-dependent methyltransferase family protein [Candidatus Pacearchaeota archaeon]